MLAHKARVNAIEVTSRTQNVSVIVKSETVSPFAKSFAAQFNVVRLRGTTAGAAEIGFGVESDDGFAFKFLLELAGRTTVSFVALQTARLSCKARSILAEPHEFPELTPVL